MAFPEAVRARFDRSFELYRGLMEIVPEAALAARIPGVRSNTLGAQLWCVVGARESYARALHDGAWRGFACSLTREDCVKWGSVAAALDASGDALRRSLDGVESFDPPRHGLMLDALEHEAAHQGQLIRYLYALDLPIPRAWAARYALR